VIDTDFTRLLDINILVIVLKFNVEKIKEYIADKTVLILVAIFFTLLLEPILHPIEFLTTYFGIEFALLSSSGVKDSSFYTCSALIQAYAALIAILYSLISIHLQTRYGHFIIHALIKRFIKPLIVLGLFSTNSFLIMILNASETISLTVKHVFLFLLEPLAFISVLIFLYTHVVATAKMSPSRIVLELLDPRRLEKLLETPRTMPRNEAINELAERVSASFTILRIMLENLSDVEEIEDVVRIMTGILEAIPWRIHSHREIAWWFVDYIVYNMDKKIKNLLREIAITKPDEAPSAVWFGKLLGAIANAYILIGEGENLDKHVALTNAIAHAYIYKAPLASNTFYPEEVLNTYGEILAFISFLLEETKITPSKIITEELIIPLIKTTKKYIKHIEDIITQNIQNNKQPDELYIDTLNLLEYLVDKIRKHLPQQKQNNQTQQ